MTRAIRSNSFLNLLALLRKPGPWCFADFSQLAQQKPAIEAGFLLASGSGLARQARCATCLVMSTADTGF